MPNDENKPADSGTGDVNIEQLKAENATYKSLVEQQKQTIEKHEGLIGKLRKIESGAERAKGIIKEALGAVAMGVPEHYQKLVEPLPIEQRWELLKAYPRQSAVVDAPQDQQDQQLPTNGQSLPPQGQQPQGQPVPNQQPHGQAQQQQQQQQTFVPGRPAAPQIETPYDRAKRDLQASGTLNMHSLLEAFMRTKT